MANLFERFQQEFLVTAAPFMDIQVLKGNYQAYASSWGPCALSLQSLFAIYATAVLYYRQKKQSSSFVVFLTAEIAALLLIFFPLFLPMFKQFRYLAALSAFVVFMSIHSRLHNTTQTEANFMEHLLSTLFHDIPQKLVLKVVPTVGDFLYLIFFNPYVTMTVMIDGCMYLVTDFIPVNVSTTNGVFICQAFALSMWICFGILSVLDAEAAILSCLGYPLPMDARHKNPLMSISFSEFWGTRWNPLIGKLLQVRSLCLTLY